MISILIPCYDYDAYPIVSKIEKQALILNIDFEIICIDDGSFSSKNEHNQKINLLTNCKFIETKKNIGRVKNRVLLAESAQYDWVIFIDVDTTTSDYFLRRYIELIDKNSIVFGGCFFDKPKGSENNFLRYEFGKNREAKKSLIRNKSPYKFMSSRNFMGKRALILSIFSEITNSSYGNDYMLGSILKEKKINVVHVDNEVSVNEIEENKIFIEKTKKALDNLYKNYRENKIKTHDISILSAFIFLEKFLLKKLFLKFSALFRNSINNSLNSQIPSLFLFDIFRLDYLCNIKDS